MRECFKNWLEGKGLLLTILTSLLVIILGVGFSLNEIEKEDNKIEAIRNIALSVGAIVTFIFAIWRSSIADKTARANFEALNHSTKVHLNEIFTKATEQLASEQSAIKLAGIYSLEKVTKETYEYDQIIMNVLCSFVRSPKYEGEEFKEYMEQNRQFFIKYRKPVDAAIGVIISIMRKEPYRSRKKGLLIDLSETTLKKKFFNGFNLQAANFEDATLEGVDFSGAYLMGANCQNASFKNVYLVKTKMEGAYLMGANLLEVVNYSGAIFKGAMYDDNTIFPEYFNPEENEMIYINRLKTKPND
jgi:uncharacterized protein YjbI with pentapeptide repeats